LFAVYDQHEATLWDVRSGQVQLRLRSVSSDSALHAISADGKTLVGPPVRGKRGTFKVWDMARSASSFALDDSFHARSGVIVASNGTIVARIPDSGVMREKEVQCWDLIGRKKSTVFRVANQAAAALSPDGHTLVSVGEDTMGVWDVGTGRQRAVFPYPRKKGCHCYTAVSPNGRALAMLNYEKNEARLEMRWDLTMWDLVAGRERFTVRGVYHEERVTSSFVGAFLTFRPDGKVLVGNLCPTAVQFWTVDTGEELTPLRKEGWDVRGGAFRPDGKVLALACGRMVRLWDLTKNQECGCLPGHTDIVTALGFSPDGRTLATGGEDRTVRLWDVASGLEQASLSGWRDWVCDVAFSTDGRHLVAADSTGTVRVWEAVFPP
jgi:WD40 repeat protein